MEYNKKELRKKYKDFRAKLSSKDIAEQSSMITEQIRKLDIWDKNYYHVFMSILELREIDTTGIIKLLESKSKKVVISSSEIKTKCMTHYLLDKDTIIEKNNYNIPEPIKGNLIASDKIEVLFIPLLAYDKKGTRVGYGAGFYDKFLSECKKDALKIGLSFFPPEEFIGSEEHDIPLDACVMPNSVIFFT